MKVLIIEDEAPAFRRLQKVLEELSADVEIVEVLDSVEGAVAWFSAGHQVDLALMDIQLSDGISFEIFDQVRVTVPVVFTTAFDEYMLNAFQVNGIDYLLKPIKKEDLNRSLKKYSLLKSQFSIQPDLTDILAQVRVADRQYKPRFLVRQGERMMSVETQNIAYFFTQHGVVHLCTFEGQKHLTDYVLDDLQGQLDPEKFYRANRQYLINFHGIVAAHKYHRNKLLVEVSPQTREPIIVSAERASAFKSWLGK